MNKKILYIVPLVPSATGSGGRRAALNHLNSLKKENCHVDLVCLDFEEQGLSQSEDIRGINHVILSRGLPSLRYGLFGKILALVNFIFSSLPRGVAITSSLASEKAISELLKKTKYDFLVFEHLTAYGMFCNIGIKVPVVYIAQNIEYKIIEDKIYAEKNSLKRILLKIEKKRIKKIEKIVLENSSKSIFISSADAEFARSLAPTAKILIWPELPVEKNIVNVEFLKKNVIFVGSNYFPNLEAVQWIIDELSPAVYQLDPTIRFDIIGTSKENYKIRTDIKNVNFFGFVSSNELEKLHLTSSVFISPVVLGSGIKVKVIEAISYGLPVALTKASRAGIDFLDDFMELTRDASVDAKNLAALLNDSVRLEKMSSRALKKLAMAKSDRARLSDFIFQ